MNVNTEPCWKQCFILRNSVLCMQKPQISKDDTKMLRAKGLPCSLCLCREKPYRIMHYSDIKCNSTNEVFNIKGQWYE